MKKYLTRNKETLKNGNADKLKWLILISVFQCFSFSAFSQNVNITNPTSRPVPVNIVSGGPGTGAAHQANSQVTSSTTAGTLLAARPTRRSALIRNTDAAITVYLGAATVTAGNGMPLKAGESVVVTSITLLQVIAASGTPVVAIFDEYD